MAPYFGLFMVTWIYLRHYLNLRIIWSLFTEFRTVGPYVLDWADEQYKCWISQFIAVGLLSALQALNLFWLFFIIRIAYRVVFLDVIADDRSEDEEDEPNTLEENEKAPLLANGGSNGHAPNGKAEGTVKANGSPKKI